MNKQQQQARARTMATPPPTNPNDWLAVAGAIGGLATGVAALIGVVASYVKLTARVERVEENEQANAERINAMGDDVQALQLNDREGQARREEMYKLLEESRRDIKQILTTVAQLAARKPDE